MEEYDARLKRDLSEQNLEIARRSIDLISDQARDTLASLNSIVKTCIDVLEEIKEEEDGDDGNKGSVTAESGEVIVQLEEYKNGALPKFISDIQVQRRSPLLRYIEERREAVLSDTGVLIIRLKEYECLLKSTQKINSNIQTILRKRGLSLEWLVKKTMGVIKQYFTDLANVYRSYEGCKAIGFKTTLKQAATYVPPCTEASVGRMLAAVKTMKLLLKSSQSPSDHKGPRCRTCAMCGGIFYQNS